MADSSVKVLMVGGARAGKTSILAGLYDTMLGGEVSEVIKLEDKTVRLPGQETMEDKITSLKNIISTFQGRTFLVDDSHTYSFSKHIIEFIIPGTSNKMTIEFVDANGEFYESKSDYDTGDTGDLISKDDIVKVVEESDIFIIAVDTPFLMEATNPDNELCTEPVNKAYNHVADVQHFLTYLDDKDGLDAKMVVFVPVKCEKWAHSGRINEVSERVKDVYSVVINNLAAYKNIEIDILPVETAGSIEFREHLEAYVCSGNGRVNSKCSFPWDEDIIRFSNGEVTPYNSRIYTIDDDPDARISLFHKLIRPNSWFHLTGTEYKPHNCEQLAYFILKFVLTKYLFMERKRRDFKIPKYRDDWSLLLNLLRWLVSLFVHFVSSLGTMSYEQLQKVVDTIESRKLMKQGVDGIVNIKKSLLN